MALSTCWPPWSVVALRRPGAAVRAPSGHHPPRRDVRLQRPAAGSGQHGQGLGARASAATPVSALEWYRVFSFAMRPKRVLGRRDLQVVERRSPRGAEVFALLADAVVVRCLDGEGPGYRARDGPGHPDRLPLLARVLPAGHPDRLTPAQPLDAHCGASASTRQRTKLNNRRPSLSGSGRADEPVDADRPDPVVRRGERLLGEPGRREPAADRRGEVGLAAVPGPDHGRARRAQPGERGDRAGGVLVADVAQHAAQQEQVGGRAPGVRLGAAGVGAPDRDARQAGGRRGSRRGQVRRPARPAWP